MCFPSRYLCQLFIANHPYSAVKTIMWSLENQGTGTVAVLLLSVSQMPMKQ